MQFFKYFLITLVILALLDPTEGWSRKKLKKLGRSVKKRAKSIKKATCRFVFGVGCPAAVGALGTALATGTSGTGSAVVAIGVAAGTNACHVREKKCKRSAEMTEVILPFSDEISDYDKNGDKLVTYEEFVFAVLRSVHLADPQELIKPFVFSDFDGNGILDTEEFSGAPLLFAHVPLESRNVTAAA